ncbi:MAG: SDR family oxidoreductase [Candidatus Marinimicrobia bacterium]|nr:SDR family oxidoreductase [Candidatus Neomarinimicrobiota bacterium]
MALLRGKIVVITGASSGMGAEAAKAFGLKGARVVLAARRLERLQTVCEEIESAGGQCLAVPTDVSREGDVTQLFATVEQHFGPANILVNSAGRGLQARLLDTDYDQWQSVINTNLTSVYLCTRAAVKQMVANGVRGHIVTVASIAALYSAPGYVAYCASKHGVLGFQRAVKWELRRKGIKVSTIFPARVDTDFFGSYSRQPTRWQTLPARSLGRYIVAVASGSWLVRAVARSGLLVRRLAALFSIR